MAEKVTKLRIQIPRGMKVEELVEKIEVSFEVVEPNPNEIKVNLDCCVDATIVSPVSTIAHTGGRSGSGNA
ncbi:MAG: hypothetical protein AB1918_09090 [Pseudomonadota bacterium]